MIEYQTGPFTTKGLYIGGTSPYFSHLGKFEDMFEATFSDQVLVSDSCRRFWDPSYAESHLIYDGNGLHQQGEEANPRSRCSLIQILMLWGGHDGSIISKNDQYWGMRLSKLIANVSDYV
jgi:hypothetical protein